MEGDNHAGAEPDLWEANEPGDMGVLLPVVGAAVVERTVTLASSAEATAKKEDRRDLLPREKATVCTAIVNGRCFGWF